MSSHKKLIISREAIASRVKELAAVISRDYAGKDPLLVGILKGGFIFLADLARALDFPVQVDFVRLRSYGAGTKTSGEVHISKDVELPMQGRHILIVEDIVDAGLTLDRLDKKCHRVGIDRRPQRHDVAVRDLGDVSIIVVGVLASVRSAAP